MDIILLCFVAVNVIGFFAMGVDKAKARAKAWRIPEKTLLTIAVIGGGLGVWLGMEVFRHKTRHWYFKYGVPAIFLGEVVAVLYFMKLSNMF